MGEFKCVHEVVFSEAGSAIKHPLASRLIKGNRSRKIQTHGSRWLSFTASTATSSSVVDSSTCPTGTVALLGAPEENRTERYCDLLGGGTLLLIGIVVGFGVAHLAYRQERKQLIDGYHFTTPERPELAWLETADPLADFREAVAKNDLRFIGVYGGAGAPWVPGVPDTRLTDRKEVRFLPVGAT